MCFWRFKSHDGLWISEIWKPSPLLFTYSSFHCYNRGRRPSKVQLLSTLIRRNTRVICRSLYLGSGALKRVEEKCFFFPLFTLAKKRRQGEKMWQMLLIEAIASICAPEREGPTPLVIGGWSDQASSTQPETDPSRPKTTLLQVLVLPGWRHPWRQPWRWCWVLPPKPRQESSNDNNANKNHFTTHCPPNEEVFVSGGWREWGCWKSIARVFRCSRHDERNRRFWASSESGGRHHHKVVVWKQRRE